MTRRYNRFLSVISLLSAFLLFPLHTGYSCGPFLGLDHIKYSLFAADLDGNTGMSQFYYSERFFNGEGPDPEKKDYHKNCAEWQQQTGRGVPEKDIYAIQYQTDPDEFTLAYKTGDWPRPLAGNRFVQWLRQPAHKDYLQYMQLSKQMEWEMFGTHDDWAQPQNYWYYRDPEFPDSNKMYTFALTTAALCRKTSNRFLATRYAFQGLKASFYNRHSLADTGLALYSQYLAASPSIVAKWALLFRGQLAAIEKEKNTYLLRAFDETEEKKFAGYNYLDKKELEKYIAQGENKHLRSVAMTMRMMRNPGRSLPMLRQLLQNEPQSGYLPMLIAREINKAEDWIWTPQMQGSESQVRSAAYTQNVIAKNKTKDKAYLGELLQFINSWEPGTKHNTIKQLALAHLYNMQQQYTKAIATLKNINDNPTNRETIQLCIEHAIALINGSDVETLPVQEELATLFARMELLRPEYKKVIEIGDFGNEKTDDLRELYLMLSKKFQALKDIPRAGIWYNKAGLLTSSYDGLIDTWENHDSWGYQDIAFYDRNASAADMDSLLSFRHRKAATLFERQMKDIFQPKEDWYRDLKGTIQFRKKEYKEALATFQQMSPDFWEKNYQYKDYLTTTPLTATPTLVPRAKNMRIAPYKTLNKATLLTDLVTTLDSIENTKQPETLAGLYLKLANAWYNTSYWGQQWMMISYGHDFSEPDLNYQFNRWDWFDIYPNGAQYKSSYYQCADAVAAYKKALSLTKNKELAATCTLMLYECEANTLAHNRQEDYDDNKKFAFSLYLRSFLKDYRNTAVYALAVTNCPDIKELVK